MGDVATKVWKATQFVGGRRPKCAICGSRVTWWDSDVDHILPKSKGGANAPENYAVTHTKCNNRKGNRTTQPDPTHG